MFCGTNPSALSPSPLFSECLRTSGSSATSIGFTFGPREYVSKARKKRPVVEGIAAMCEYVHQVRGSAQRKEGSEREEEFRTGDAFSSGRSKPAVVQVFPVLEESSCTGGQRPMTCNCICPKQVWRGEEESSVASGMSGRRRRVRGSQGGGL